MANQKKQVIVEVVLTTAVANSGTYTISAYPSGYAQANFITGNAKADGEAVVNDNDVYLESASKISIAYNSSTIVITNSTGKSWAAGSRIRFGLAYADAVDRFAGQVSAAITALTDNSGGTASDTLAAISATYVQAEVRNSIASVAAKINRIQAALQKAGITL